MRRAAVLAALALVGCGSGTRFEYDPETKRVEFERTWVGGPFYAEFDVTYPDGTRVAGIVQSDPNLDAAVQRAANHAELIGRALDKIPNAGGGS